jgi:hypothetical protein
VEMAKGVDGEHVALAFKWRRQTERERERERRWRIEAGGDDPEQWPAMQHGCRR